MNTVECDDFKEVQSGEHSPDGIRDENEKKNKKPWSKPVIKDLGEITVEDFIKTFKPEADNKNQPPQ